ncbi:probable WRKY transcription factor 27 [Solanum stenotomum]|uniref:probable WRKY transcription factor 27 n=1 Tax=Solanum stenotomum TaxID=172797 RepID=UPI0020D05AA9|nr:probable WRKY transcription factor 27 [Solanum stenotomum]
MEDNDWDLSVVVRSCNINKPNDVTVPNSGFVTSENDDWNAFDKKFVADMPNFNDLSEIFSIDFSVAHQKKSNDQVIITDQNSNQEMYLHPIQSNQFSQQIILPPLPTMIMCVSTTTTTPHESIYLQQLEKSDDQVIIMNQNDNLYLDPIKPTQFSQQIFLPTLPTTITCMPTKTTTPQELIDPQQQFEKLDDQVIIMDQNKNQEMYYNPIQPTQFCQQTFLPPLPTMITCVPTTTTTPQESIDLQQQLVIQDQVYPNFTMHMPTPLIKTFKRKNQSTRVVYEVLQEELTDDKWAWHKYGQKSIKRSPFPRNYFKCSTLGSCKATKIIEKSPKDENYFLVSYSVEHDHNPPTYRTSLALYNNSSKRKLPKSINIVPKALNLNASPSSSKRAKRFKVDASSISPFAPTLEIERNNEMVDVFVENKDDIEEEENMYDNIFMDFEELHELLLPSNGNEIDKRN